MLVAAKPRSWNRAAAAAMIGSFAPFLGAAPVLAVRPDREPPLSGAAPVSFKDTAPLRCIPMSVTPGPPASSGHVSARLRVAEPQQRPAQKFSEALDVSDTTVRISDRDVNT